MGFEICTFLFCGNTNQHRNFYGDFFLWKDKSIQGEFIQASYRSSAALLGIAFIQNIYGDAGMAPLMIIGSVPLYNIMAVVVLSFFSRSLRK